MPKFREITGQFVGYVPDGSDSDIYPDRSPMNGGVVFTPRFSGGLIAFPELSPPEFVQPEPIPARIVDGFIMVEVTQGEGEEATTVLQPLSLMVTEDEEASQVWSWRAEFHDIRIGRAYASETLQSWTFRIPEGDGPIDLTDLWPVKSSPGISVTKGPRGAGLELIELVDEELVFTYSDGKKSHVPMPDAVPGPPGKDGTPGKDGKDGAPGVVENITASDITDSTATGRNVLKAANAAAARSAIGAGTSSISTGTAAELNTGTATTARAWASKVLADYTEEKVQKALDDAKHDLVGELEAPLVIAHRGGRYVYPEHSMEGYIASMESGFLPEPDIQFLKDGTMVCLHDATVDRTMTGISGNVSTLTRRDWIQARIKPVYDGGKSASPVLFEDVLDQLGNRVVLVPEIKGGASTTEVQQVIDAVKSRGLEKSVIIQSADLSACQLVAGAGCHALLLLNTTLPSSNPVPSGVKYIGASQKMSEANLNTVLGWGATVVVWTLNSRNAVAGLPSGVEGYFSDDPWYTSDRLQSEGVARWRSGQGWPSKHNTEQTSSSTGAESSTRQKISGGQLYVDASSSGSLTVSTDVSHINGGFAPEDFIMKGTFTLGAKSVSSTANTGFALYRNTNGPDSTFYDGAKAGQEGITFVMRRNGQLQGWEYINGASAANLGTANLDEPLTLDGKVMTVELILTKSGSDLTMTCVDTGLVLNVTTQLGGVFTPALRTSRMETWVGDVSVDPY